MCAVSRERLGVLLVVVGCLVALSNALIGDDVLGWVVAVGGLALLCAGVVVLTRTWSAGGGGDG